MVQAVFSRDETHLRVRITAQLVLLHLLAKLHGHLHIDPSFMTILVREMKG